MLGHYRPASEMPFKCWPAKSGILILPPLIKLKKILHPRMGNSGVALLISAPGIDLEQQTLPACLSITNLHCTVLKT